MRQSNFSNPAQGKACVCITAAVYDRRAIDSTATLPLINSLNHLAYLTSTSPRIREMVTLDGGLDRLIRILRQVPKAPSTSASSPGAAARNAAGGVSTKEMQAIWKWSLAFQCVVNIGVRGSEAVRTRVVEAGMIPVTVKVLESHLAVVEARREEKKREEHEARRAASAAAAAAAAAQDPSAATAAASAASEAPASRSRSHRSGTAVQRPASSAQQLQAQAQAQGQAAQQPETRPTTPPEAAQLLVNVGVGSDAAEAATAAGLAMLATSSASGSAPDGSDAQHDDAHAAPHHRHHHHHHHHHHATLLDAGAVAAVEDLLQRGAAGGGAEVGDLEMAPVRRTVRGAAGASASATDDDEPELRPSQSGVVSETDGDAFSQAGSAGSAFSDTDRAHSPFAASAAASQAGGDAGSGSGSGSELEPASSADVDMAGGAHTAAAASAADDPDERRTPRASRATLAALAAHEVPPPPLARQETVTPSNAQARHHHQHAGPADDASARTERRATIRPAEANANAHAHGHGHGHHHHHATHASQQAQNILNSGEMIYRDEEVLLSLQLLAYLSKYPHVRHMFHNEEMLANALPGSLDSFAQLHAHPSTTESNVSWTPDTPYRRNVFSIAEKFTLRSSRSGSSHASALGHSRLAPEIQYWAGVIMRNACRKDECRGGIRQCANMQCGKWESFPREFAKCRRCRKAKYCSKQCQSRGWQSGHRFWCSARSDEDVKEKADRDAANAAAAAVAVAGAGPGAFPQVVPPTGIDGQQDADMLAAPPTAAAVMAATAAAGAAAAAAATEHGHASHRHEHGAASSGATAPAAGSSNARRAERRHRERERERIDTSSRSSSVSRTHAHDEQQLLHMAHAHAHRHRHAQHQHQHDAAEHPLLASMRHAAANADASEASEDDLLSSDQRSLVGSQSHSSLAGLAAEHGSGGPSSAALSPSGSVDVFSTASGGVGDTEADMADDDASITLPHSHSHGHGHAHGLAPHVHAPRLPPMPAQRTDLAGRPLPPPVIAQFDGAGTGEELLGGRATPGATIDNEATFGRGDFDQMRTIWPAGGLPPGETFSHDFRIVSGTLSPAPASPTSSVGTAAAAAAADAMPGSSRIRRPSALRAPTARQPHRFASGNFNYGSSDDLVAPGAGPSSAVGLGPAVGGGGVSARRPLREAHARLAGLGPLFNATPTRSNSGSGILSPPSAPASTASSAYLPRRAYHHLGGAGAAAAAAAGDRIERPLSALGVSARHDGGGAMLGGAAGGDEEMLGDHHAVPAAPPQPIFDGLQHARAVSSDLEFFSAPPEFDELMGAADARAAVIHAHATRSNRVAPFVGRPSHLLAQSDDMDVEMDD